MNSLVSLLRKTLILFDQGPILMTSFNLNCLLSDPSPNMAEVRASTYKY